MKLNLGHIAAVVALTVSAPSFAAISTDNWGGGAGALSGTGIGELFFVAYDASRAPSQQTFILDLNLTANSFVNSNASLINSFGVTSSALQSWVAGSSSPANILWNMGGLSNTSTTFGTFVTHGVPGAGATIDGTELLPDSVALQVAMNNGEGFANAANATLGSGESTFGTGNAGYLAGVWGPSYGGVYTFDTTANLGSQMLMSFFFADPSNLEGAPLVQTFAGLWGVDTATGRVAYTGEVSAVPLPAAVWLLGSGLLGLAGIGRRRRS